jgi:hypothetical protein
MKTLNFNPEILSNKPTHFDEASQRKVKVFNNTLAYNFQTNEAMLTAEIMTGKSKGLWTNVYVKNLIKL